MIAPVLFLVVAMLFAVAAVVFWRHASTWERGLYASVCLMGFITALFFALIAAALGG